MQMVLIIPSFSVSLHPIQDGEEVTRKPGDRWLIHGPLEYVPPAEVEVLELRRTIPLAENEGIYVRDIKTGKVSGVDANSVALSSAAQTQLATISGDKSPAVTSNKVSQSTLNTTVGLNDITGFLFRYLSCVSPPAPRFGELEKVPPSSDFRLFPSSVAWAGNLPPL